MIKYRLLGHYHLRRLISPGRYADMYEAVHISLGRPAAIKVLDLERVQGAKERAWLDEHFYHEACMMEAAKHPAVVELFDYGEEGAVRYIAMEYAERGSLAERHPSGQRVPPGLVLSYARQVGWALQHLHSLGLIHRDIKPENLLLNSQGRVLLGDFGLVEEESLRARYRLYGGTRLYMAPEQEEGCPTFASDQYAFATMIFEWLTGHAPFEGTPEEVSRQRRLHAAPSPRLFVPSISPVLEHVLRRALHRSPQQRYEYVLDFVEELEDALRPVTAPIPAVAPRRVVTRPPARAHWLQLRQLKREQLIARRRAARQLRLEGRRAHDAPVHDAPMSEYPHMVRDWEVDAWSVESVEENVVEPAELSIQPSWK